LTTRLPSRALGDSPSRALAGERGGSVAVRAAVVPKRTPRPLVPRRLRLRLRRAWPRPHLRRKVRPPPPYHLDTPRPSPRTNRTRRVPQPVLIGHAASLTPYSQRAHLLASHRALHPSAPPRPPSARRPRTRRRRPVGRGARADGGRAQPAPGPVPQQRAGATVRARRRCGGGGGGGARARAGGGAAREAMRDLAARGRARRDVLLGRGHAARVPPGALPDRAGVAPRAPALPVRVCVRACVRACVCFCV